MFFWILSINSNTVVNPVRLQRETPETKRLRHQPCPFVAPICIRKRLLGKFRHKEMRSGPLRARTGCASRDGDPVALQAAFVWPQQISEETIDCR